MSYIRKRAVEIIERLPEDKVIYIFNILNNIDASQNVAREKLTALFGSVHDETFERPEQLEFMLDAERASM